jgi:hypothetical protein
MLSPIDSMSGRASKSPSRPKFISPAYDMIATARA